MAIQHYNNYPTKQQFETQLICDFNTGKVYWVLKDGSLKESGYQRPDKRYIIGFQGKLYLRSHIIWICAGRTIDPEMVIDHIKRGNPGDDRLVNLHQVTQCHNKRNSDYIGYDWHKASGKWRIQIWVDTINYHCGLTVSEEHAKIIRKMAEKLIWEPDYHDVDTIKHQCKRLRHYIKWKEW